MIEIDAHKIAEIQLETAIKLYKEGNYISAITLAGAAEGYLDGILKHSTPYRTSLDMLKDNINFLEPTLDKKYIADSLNRSRNILKHFDPNKPMLINPVSDALLMIYRALSNYSKLTSGAGTKMMIEFVQDPKVKENLKKVGNE